MIEAYSKIKIIGEGSYGQVFLMKTKTVPQKIVCVKVIHLKDLSKTSSLIQKRYQDEVKCMRQLNHPFITGYIDSFLSKCKNIFYIVMPYYPGGDLHSYLQKIFKGSRKLLCEDRVWILFTQICLGLCYMHHKNILHRDVKSQNIFLFDKEKRLVLGDLGISKSINQDELAQTCIGTPCFMAPEQLKNQSYGFPSDVWSLGCLLYELCTFRYPFTAPSMVSLSSRITQGNYTPIHPRFSKRLEQLLDRMLSIDPSHRPRIEEILRDYIPSNFLFQCLPIDKSILAQQIQDLNIKFPNNPLNHEVGSMALEKKAKQEINEKIEKEYKSTPEVDSNGKSPVIFPIISPSPNNPPWIPHATTPIESPKKTYDKNIKTCDINLDLSKRVKEKSIQTEVTWQPPVEVNFTIKNKVSQHKVQETLSDLYLGIPRVGVVIKSPLRGCPDVRQLRKREYHKAVINRKDYNKTIT